MLSGTQRLTLGYLGCRVQSACGLAGKLGQVICCLTQREVQGTLCPFGGSKSPGSCSVVHLLSPQQSFMEESSELLSKMLMLHGGQAQLEHGRPAAITSLRPQHKLRGLVFLRCFPLRSRFNNSKPSNKAFWPLPARPRA